MAQDAELKLKVSLDLAYFRAQLSRLPLETTGYSAPINLRIDNRSILTELRRIDKIFAKRNYNLQVNDTAIKAARANAQKLKNTLDLLQRTKYTIDIGTRQTGASIEDLQNLFGRGKSGQVFGAGAVGQARGNVARQALLARLEKESLSKGGYNLPGLKRVIGELGGTPTGSSRSELSAQAKKLAKEADDALIDRVYASVKDLQMNMKYAGGGGYGVGQSISKMINRMSLASGDPFAARQKLRQLPPKYITTEMAGRATEQAMANEALGQRGAPVSSKFQNSFDKYLEAVVSQAMADASIARQQYAARTSPLQQLIPTVPPRQYFQATGIPLLPSAGQTSGAQPAPRMLPAAGGTGGYFNAGNRPGGGLVPPGGFPTEGMLGGKAAPATFIGAGSSIEKFKTAIDIANASTRNFRASSLPLIGGLKEIGGEFLNATKQVLLYGTAYKGLAFITSLPGQILNAAKGQQQFNNALQTATQDTGTFAKELLYVDNVQRAFGLNLETTRTGFTKLYASMGPTGFDSGSIEKLFTGISAATAALQLTPDKAERVIYAFGQMASKGQIMSEELKGQLGDVLPGALAIFAKAAGMSVKEFSQAMEDGVFVGGKFREVFAKVSDELMSRFGTGAQAAGRSLQGLLNTVQGDFTRTLESFTPLANIAAQAVLTPLSGALKQLSMAAQIAMGEQDRVQKQLLTAQQDVKDLKVGGADPEQIRAAEQNVAALTARLQVLNLASKDPAIAQQSKNIQSFVGEISKAANAVMNVTRVIGSVLGPVLTFLGTNLSTVITVLASFATGLAVVRVGAAAAMGVLTLMNVLIKGAAGGAVGVNALSAAFRVLGISATGAQIGVIGLGRAFTVLMVSSGIGLAVGILTAIASAALGMGSAMSQAAAQAKQAMQDMAQAAIVGNTALINMQAATYQAQIATLKQVQAQITKRGQKQGRAGGAIISTVTPVESQMLGAAGAQIPAGPVTKAQLDKAVNDALYIQQTGAKAAQQYQKIAQQNAEKIGLNKPTPSPSVAAAEDTAESSTKKEKDYISQRSSIIQRLGEIEQARINLISNLSQEERNLLKAAAAYRSEDAQALAKYNEDMAKASEYVGAAKARYIKDLQDTLKAEQDLAKARRDAAIMGPLLQMQENLIKQNYESFATLEALKQGRTELTQVEKAALVIAINEQAIKKSGIKLTENDNRKRAEANKQLLEQAKLADEVNRKIKIEQRLNGLRDEIALLRARNEEEKIRLQIAQENKGATKEEINKIYDLEKVAKNIRDVRRIIDSFVTDTSSDYKGFLKAVISGEDAVDALEQFQQGLKDRVLTIFLDFTMKPIEDFFKEVVGGNIIEKLFPKTEEEKKQEAAKAPIDANTEATKTNTTAIEKLTAAISGGGGTSTTGAGFSAYAQGAPSFLPMDSAIFDSAISFASQKTSDKLNTFAYETTGFADNLNQTVDGIKGATDKAKQNGTGFLEGLGGVVQGIGMLAGSAMGIVAGIKQIEKGDTSSVISGIGSILTGIGGSILGFGKLFGANGGVAAGGWKPFPATAFASGGMVTGPTLGLVGEGKYNEAIVPLPDGRSIPVQLQDSGVRDKMGGGMGGGYASPMISMSFETTKIGGVEYVSRDQLELAMMETRRQAANDGAKRGMSMTLDRLQQSPQTRNRLGLR